MRYVIELLISLFANSNVGWSALKFAHSLKKTTNTQRTFSKKSVSFSVIQDTDLEPQAKRCTHEDNHDNSASARLYSI
jgi:hypothetical protein